MKLFKILYPYCYHLNNFYLLKTQFLNNAFLPDQSKCNTSVSTLTNAEHLHNYTETHSEFIKQMEIGCQLGGQQTACHIKNSNVSDILEEFNSSYYSYQNIPSTLCTPFAEFTNNLESLFITGGCYLDQNQTDPPHKTTHAICQLTKWSPRGGYVCHLTKT